MRFPGETDEQYEQAKRACAERCRMTPEEYAQYRAELKQLKGFLDYCKEH